MLDQMRDEVADVQHGLEEGPRVRPLHHARGLARVKWGLAQEIRLGPDLRRVGLHAPAIFTSVPSKKAMLPTR